MAGLNAGNIFEWNEQMVEKHKIIKREKELIRRWGLMVMRFERTKRMVQRKIEKTMNKLWDKYVKGVDDSCARTEAIDQVDSELEKYVDGYYSAYERYKVLNYEEYLINHRKPLTTINGEVVWKTSTTVSISSISSNSSTSVVTDEAGETFDSFERNMAPEFMRNDSDTVVSEIEEETIADVGAMIDWF